MTKTGKVSGGKPFFRGHIYTILKNPVYIGKIVHKGEVYEGEHDPIIDQETWDRTQALLEKNAPNRTTRRNTKSTALLAGLLEDAEGYPLVPQACTTRGVSYHYYVSRRLKTGDVDSGWRIPAKTIEPLVLSILKRHLANDLKLSQLLKLSEMDAMSQQGIRHAAEHLEASLKQPSQLQIHQLVERITVKPDSITVDLCRDGLSFLLPVEQTSTSRKECSPQIHEDIVLRRRGQEMKMVLGAQEDRPANPDPALILLVARATLLREQLASGEVGSIAEFAEQKKLDHSDAKKLIPLSYLAPSIIEDIVNGHQPEELTSRELHRMSDLPHCWSAQRQRLGFL